MTRHVLGALLLLGVTSAGAAAQTPGTPLLDGRTLDGWRQVGGGRFVVQPDGTLRAEGGKGVLYYARPFRDFALDLDFKVDGRETNSGVFLRADAARAGAGYQVAIQQEPPRAVYQRYQHQTGAIDSLAAPTRLAAKPVGEWNHLRVEVAGQRYQVYLNGERVNDFFGTREREGLVGLESPDSGAAGGVTFRDVRVTPLDVPDARTSLADLFDTRRAGPGAASGAAPAPIRVLVITATHGFRHSEAIEASKEVLTELGRTTEFRFDITDSASAISAENLARYDVLFLNNATLRAAPADTTLAARQAVRAVQRTPKDPLTQEQQRAIQSFVRSGKGVALVHSGLDAMYGSESYRGMVGGGLFEAHPWVKPVRVVVEDRANAATAHFGADVWVRDEIYVLDRSPRAASHVLLSMDVVSAGEPNVTGANDRPFQPTPNSGRADQPLSWVRREGEGRVFATVLGHFPDVWRRPDYLQHLLTGMRIAAGRIPADFTAGNAPPRRDPFAGADLSPKPPVVALSPAEEQHRFILPPGYRMEPVLAEPRITEPADVAFDGNGRMYVLELRSYMLDADATGELAPVSRISRHEDRDNDGVYETHTAFVDSIVFPRFVTPLGANSILTMESNADEVWKFTDTDGDGRADRKELVTTGFGRAANVEHQQASLFWAMDNWMYSTVNAFRVRWTPKGVLREATGFNGAQWGAAQDDDGKVWFQGGASGLPSYFQFPIHYGNITVRDQYEPGFDIPYGAPIALADMQGGMAAVRVPDGSLNRVTAGSGAEIYRGHRLPPELRDDYYYGEVVARVVRRVRPVVTEGLTQLRQVYQPVRAEFIRSIDPLFRPVEVANAPDGTMYVVDMYHGIIQEAEWTPRGSYLRAKIEQYQLDKITGFGRIWRLSHVGTPRDTTRPRMLDETPARLVRHLRHPSGWWRDQAQQQLVLRQDRSVVPALRAMAQRDTSLLARVHALWTLEGLGALDAALARQLMKDRSPRLRVQAIRASETLYKGGDRSLAADYRALATSDADANVAIQAMLTLKLLKAPDAERAIRAAMSASRARGVQEVGAQLLDPPPVLSRGPGTAPPLTAAQQALVKRGETIYQELCAQCHAPDGRGMPAGAGEFMAPALAGSERVQGHPEYVVRTLLHGLTGPIESETYAGGVMVPMGKNDDEWIAAVASYVRTSLQNTATVVTPAEVAKARAASAARTTPWTYGELLATVPRQLRNEGSWKVTASHNAAAATRALDFGGWSTGQPQQPGMWLQVELSSPAQIAEVRFDTPVPGARPGSPPPAVPFPRGYRVELSMDGRSWSAPAGEGTGAGGTTVVTFPPTRAKFVRLTQTATTENAPPWTVRALRIYERQQFP